MKELFSYTDEKLKEVSSNFENTFYFNSQSLYNVDYSARIQTVSKDTNPKYYKLLSEFNEKTNCPIIINTSFNIRGEPIVNSPLDAFNCFMGTDLDTLIIGNFYLEKNAQNSQLKISYKDNFELD